MSGARTHPRGDTPGVSSRHAFAPIRRATLLGAGFLSVPAISAAQEQEAVIALDEIFVTASGFEQTLAEAPASVSVIDREELQKGNVTDLADALRGVQGVVVTGTANEQDIFIRGLPGSYTLILVDGKRQSTRESRPNGSSGFEQSFIPPVSAIERIEVVRGPMSSLYGSDAIGGVINIITRPVADAWGGEVTVEGTIPDNDEDSASRQVQFYTSGPLVEDTLGLQAWGQFYDRDESDIIDGPQAQEQYNIAGRLVWTPDDINEFRLEAGRTRIENNATAGKTVEETEPPSAPATDSRRVNERDYWSLSYYGAWGNTDSEVSFLQEEGSRTSYDGTTDGDLDKDARVPKIRNSVFDAKFTTPFALRGEHTFVYGGQYFDSELSDQNPGLATEAEQTYSAWQWALFGEDEWRITEDFALTLGARFTDHEEFGGHLSPRIYGVWNATNQLVIKGGVSTGYKAPDLRQIVPGYYYTTQRGAGVIVSNSDLDPEESTTYELGTVWTADRYELSATVYQTDFRNKIESFNTGEPIAVDGITYNRWEYRNVQDAVIRGLELTGSWDATDDLLLRATYTHTDSEQKTGEFEGLPLARTPKNLASFRADWITPVDGLNSWLAVNYHGKEINAGARIGSNGTPHETDDEGNVIAYEYDAYTTVDIGANYALNEYLTLKGGIYNLFDKDITNEDNNTIQEGRNFWLAVTSTF